ncbi:hypothetical protein [Infirmifilum sp. NZ]|uniref:hypothetical protein n=1 Tax=Infirmifilum sp. NZ TaxID=2926850 RepID=UPI0027A54E3A|nr:hypothetical protein [Infirmifilum sp. NZ]UNQ72614.1 hypothetical protein MOV14_05700 [Infirmifilum sp. NZ]
MSCLEIYSSLELLTATVYESRDFFGQPVRAFELGLKEYPPVVLIGDFYGCTRASEVIADTLLKYIGDTHVVAVPCVFPSISQGLLFFSRLLLGRETSSVDEFLRDLGDFKPVFEGQGTRVLELGNLVLVATHSVQELEHIKRLQLGEDRVIVALFHDGSTMLVKAPEEALLRPLRSLLIDQMALDPLLVVHMSCWSDELICFALSERWYASVSELLEIAVSQVNSDVLCDPSVPGYYSPRRGVILTSAVFSEQLFPGVPAIEIRVGTKNYLEASKSLSAILSSVYLLRGVLDSSS